MRLKWNFLFIWFVFFIVFSGCASSGASYTDSLPAGDVPCADCGKRGEIQLEISDEVFYREWNPFAMKRLDSAATLGVFPALKIEAFAPEDCKFCHSFSDDAVDFDLSRVEDSLWVRAFPKMNRVLLFPGMQVPEEDSLFIQTFVSEILKEPFADQKMLQNLSPWKERAGTEQLFRRTVPLALRQKMEELATRYHLRYVTFPAYLRVKMDPDLGKKGGYEFETLWLFFDARLGEAVFICYSAFTASTATRVAPERFWAEPFAARLYKMLSTDISTVENR